METKNVFDDVPERLPAELIEKLLDSENMRIERIVSRGHASSPDFWYDQDENEWVILLSGAARLGFAESNATVGLKPGDYVNIPAHCRHRVEWTSANEETVWLAVFYGAAQKR